MTSNREADREGVVSGNSGTLLVSVAAGWFLALGLRFVLQAILPTITASFPATTETQAGIAVTVLWAAYGVLQFPAGITADRIGEGRVLTASLLLSAVSVLAFSVTPTYSLFVLAMGLFGAATGLYGPPRGTLLTRVFDERADRALGATLAAGSLGAAVLPALAALLVEGLGWRTMLGLTIPGFVVAALLVYRSTHRLDSKPDEKRADGGSSAAEDGPSVLSAIKIAGQSVCRYRTGLAVLAAIIMYFGYQGVTALATTYLITEKGFAQSSAGVLFGGLFVVGALSQWLAGRVAQRRRSARVLAAIAAVSVLPLVGLVVFEHRLLVAASTLLIGVRMGFAPVSNAFIIDHLPADVEGTAWGAVRTALFVVSSVASTVVGLLADIGLFDGAILLLAGLTGGAAGIYLALPSCEFSRQPW
ncbi:MFS transporter [Halorhabdus sp. CBA1104]|uniref:MFS transporter n=1 Tax=Halorhabdus sp. CBA1104 TaxID=1380432 RepID=UPI0018A6AD99|nr:MFS transporter [Halorhabdus sp. CBA1104]